MCSLRRSLLLLGIVTLFSGLVPNATEAQRPSSQSLLQRIEPSVGTTTTALDSAGGYAERSWLFGEEIRGSVLRIDFRSGDLHVIGSPFITITDTTFLPDGRLFGVSFSHLLKINPQTGSTTVVGSGIGFSGVNALASDANGTLYAGTLSGNLITIDTETGMGELIGNYGIDQGSSGDLAFDATGSLFGTVRSLFSLSDSLVLIDVTSGQAKFQGSIGFSDVFGLAFGPDGILYGSANGNSSPPVLIKIDTSSGAGSTVGNITGANSMGGLAANNKLSPIAGSLRVTGPLYLNPEIPEGQNVNGVWTFWQHQTGTHSPGGAIPGTDDTYAWDINLRVNGNNNADKGKPVFAVAPGRVVNYRGDLPPDMNTSGAVLVEHGSSCDVTPGNCWWSGYLHMEDIQVHEGQGVSRSSLLGFISDEGADNDHLHLVFYEGANNNGGLISVDATFITRPIVPPLLAFPLDVKCGGKPCTAFTADIISVLDHSLNPTQSNPTGYNCHLRGRCDNIVRAYNGEEGRREFGANAEPSGYKNRGGTPFHITGHYEGDASDGDEAATFLNYDGHSGYDYRCTLGVDDILAAANGVLSRPESDPVNRSIPSFNTYMITHEKNGIETWYLHIKKDTVIALGAIPRTVSGGNR